MKHVVLTPTVNTGEVDLNGTIEVEFIIKNKIKSYIFQKYITKLKLSLTSSK